LRLGRLAVALAATVSACGGESTPTPVDSTDTVASGTTTTSTTLSDIASDTVVDPVSGVTSEPVIPRTARETTEFEGIAVVGVLPAEPRGLVFVFHGSGGSESFVDQTETTDVLNQLEDAGYGWVATASVDRDGDRAWSLVSADPESNPDLGRMFRLHSGLVDAGCIPADIPLHGLGMSNGARFTGLWADVMRREGLNVASAVMAMGTVDRRIEDVTVPTLFVTAVNDTVVSPGRIAAQHATARAAGADVRLVTLAQRPVSLSRFTRIPGIDRNTAQAIFTGLSTAGFIDGAGELQGRAGSAAKVVRRLGVDLTASQRREVINQVSADLALHQFNAVAAPDIVGWIVAHDG